MGGISRPACPSTNATKADAPKIGQGVKRNFDDSTQFSNMFSRRAQGISITNLYFIEVFSGTAGLCAEVRRLGCQHSKGIDAHITKQVKAPVIRLDLSDVAGQKLLWRILQDPRVFAVHLGPPCGTSSRAREIKRRFGVNPLPLRSDAFPDGLANLKPRDRARVDTANQLYKLSGEILAFCTMHGILCSLENPARSHMWKTTYLNDPIEGLWPQLREVLFHHCMFGSRRRKRTKLLVNHPCYTHLCRECDGSHEHDAWGYTPTGWATAHEVEYPHGLCKEWAACLRVTLLAHGALDVPVDMQSDTTVSSHVQAQAVLGKHVRGKRLKPLMSEYASIVDIIGPSSIIQALPQVLTEPHVVSPACSTSPTTRLLPQHAKQIHAPILQGDKEGPEKIMKVAYGISWTPQAFVQCAAGLSHPGHFLDGIHEVLVEFFGKMKKKSLHALACERTAAMRKWTLRFEELRSKGEDGLKDSPSHAKEILRHKNLCLFGELIEASGSPDTNLAKDIATGFDLMGPIPSGGVFPQKPLFATLLPEQVRDISKIARSATWDAVKRTRGDDMRQEIFDATMEECNKGWMRGPFAFEQLPESAVLTRRFGVRQSATLADGSKVMKFRPIDDFSESLINSTNSCDESIQPMGVDSICATLVRRMQVRPGDSLVCKTIDLRKAYKNLPISEEALGDAYICVYSPEDGSPRAFQTLVLPFGARAAVMGFCRTSYAIWRIGVVVFNLHWTVYFDDFFLVAEVHEARHIDLAQQLLFLVTGWQTSDEKEGGFDSISRILGVQINLGDSHLGAVTISNVASRVRELTATIDELLGRGLMSAAEMRTLRGRLVFAEAQIFGRLTSVHMKRLSRLENLVGEISIDSELAESLKFLRDRVLTGGPRRVLSTVGRVFHLYTDACFESSDGGVGGVLIGGSGDVLSFFSEKVGVETANLLNPDKKQNLIFELEALAVLMGVSILLDPLAIQPNDRLVIFIDNNSVLARLVSGSVGIGFDRLIFEGVLMWEFSVCAVTWFERVASHANVADDPSRGVCSHFDVKCKIDIDSDVFVKDLVARSGAGY